MLGAQVRREFSEVHMGLAVRIVLHARDDASARAAARRAFARVAALDAALSDYRVDSEVRRLQQRPGAWVPASRELFAVVEHAVTVARESGGAFDPTVGPLVALWRDARRTGPAARRARARLGPGPRRLAADRARLRPAAGSPRRAGDAARPRRHSEGLRPAIGARGPPAARRAQRAPRGGRRHRGRRPAARPPGWHVEVPGAGPALAARAAALSHAALATSGPSEQFVEAGGVRYSHVVDPRTGLGSTTGLVATVIAPDAATADALATALTLLDVDGGRALLSRHPGVLADVRASPARP
jgi:thiamine biosynthesis lipoprotein